MKAPVGLLSGRAVCVSRWRGFAPTNSAERSKRLFTRGVVTENGIYSTAFCESAALREKVFAEFQRAEPSQSSLRDASSPEGGALSALTGRCVKAPPSGELARERLRGFS